MKLCKKKYLASIRHFTRLSFVQGLISAGLVMVSLVMWSKSIALLPITLPMIVLSIYLSRRGINNFTYRSIMIRQFNNVFNCH